MSQRPAIVLVTSSFPIGGDGSEAAGAFVADLAEELAKHAPVRIVAPGMADVKEALADGIDVFRYRTHGGPLSTLKLWHPRDALLATGVVRAGARATERAIAAGPAAHLLALWALPCGEWARRSARRHRVPYSVWTLGSDIWSLGRIPLVRARLRAILRDAEHCWSDGLKLADDTCVIAGRTVEFLPSTRKFDCVRVASLRAGPPYRLLFLGRWHPNKGIDLLLGALKSLSREEWQRVAVVEICGGGPMESEVREGVAALHSDNRPVTLRGYLDRAEAEAAMSRADFLLIPSRIESIPVVFSDAMKAGLPIVATPVGDLPTLVADGVGMLADDVSAEAFANAIRAAIATDGTEQFVPALRAMATRFSLPALAAGLAMTLSPEPVG